MELSLDFCNTPTSPPPVPAAAAAAAASDEDGVGGVEMVDGSLAPHDVCSSTQHSKHRRHVTSSAAHNVVSLSMSCTCTAAPLYHVTHGPAG